MSKPDGGPAFPASTHAKATNSAGMSLRDYFAGQALMGMYASGGHRAVAAEIAKTPEAFCMDPVGVGHAAELVIAAMAYATADAMLEERGDE